MNEMSFERRLLWFDASYNCRSRKSQLLQQSKWSSYAMQIFQLNNEGERKKTNMVLWIFRRDVLAYILFRSRTRQGISDGPNRPWSNAHGHAMHARFRRFEPVHTPSEQIEWVSESLQRE
jgi:hypothetical protein